jgi:hypothetical protein
MARRSGSYECCVCKKELERYSLDRIDYNGKHYCSRCFCKMLTDKKRGKLTEQEAIKKTEEELKKRGEIVNKQIERDNFYYWLEDAYNITIIPEYFYIKIDKITKGEYKDMRSPIPFSSIVDMWYKGLDWLNKINYNKHMDGVSRINYDLAILLSYYDVYKQHMEERNEVRTEYEQTQNNLANLGDMMKYIEPKNVDTGVADILGELEKMYD